MTSKKPKKTASVKTLPCGRPMSYMTVAEQQGTFLDNDELLNTLLVRLQNFVVSQGLNHSEVRAKILQTIIIEARHFKPQDLIVRLNKRYPEVGRATLYRTLPILVESGILQEGPTDSEGQSFYELTDTEHHDHIVCLDCEKIFEFHDEEIEQLQDQVTTQLNFTPRSHRHVIYASCQFLKTQK